MSVLLLDFAALSKHILVGCFSGSVCILVRVRRILLCSRKCGNAKAISLSSVVIGVVLEHPKIAFIPVRCAVSNLLILFGGVC
jgi:hypothetical protein